MANTIVSKFLIRQGSLQSMPVLSPGEFGLATDEQRLFLGQAPIVGAVVTSDNTIVELDFSTNFNGINVKLDLETVNEFVIDVYDSVLDTTITFNSASVTLNDTRFTLAHGFGRTLEINDTFTLRYNKEIISYKAEQSGNGRVQSLYLQKNLPAGDLEFTGIDFLAEVKSSIEIDYYLHTATSHRDGTLNIGIHDVAQGNFSIHDEFSNNGNLDDVDFSIVYDSGIFKLYYDTTLTEQMQFNFVQKSFRRMISA